MDTTRVGKYYDRSTEQGRFDSSHGRLEFLRSKIILERELPPPPARIIDIGGATGAYSFWLADRGYDVSLVDLSERHVEIASEKNREAVRKLSLVERADALGLPFPDGGFDAALIMGPLYHSTATPGSGPSGRRGASSSRTDSSPRHSSHGTRRSSTVIAIASSPIPPTSNSCARIWRAASIYRPRTGTITSPKRTSTIPPRFRASWRKRDSGASN
jgi:SAM-dependent methyltransferase